MSEKLPVAFVTYVVDTVRPGDSPMKDREIVTVFDYGDRSYRDHCVYMNGTVLVDDTPNDTQWPSVELVIDGESGLGWHGWYRAFSTRQAAEAWVADPEAPLKEFMSRNHGMTPEEFRAKYGKKSD